MKTVVVSLYEAFPPASGAASVTFHLSRHLAGEKTLIQVTGEERPPERLGDLAVVSVAVPPAGRLTRVARLFLRLGRLSEAVRKEAADIVILEGASWALYFDCLLRRLRRLTPNPTIVYHAHNVEYLLRKQKQRCLVAGLTRWAEGRVVRWVDLCTAVSEVDRGQFAILYGVRPIILSNAVDAELFERVTPDEIVRVREKYLLGSPLVLFMGLTTYRPNAEAIEFLVKAVFPHVLRQHPSARLAVIGGPTAFSEPWLSAPGNIPFREIPAVLASSDVCVAPIFSGSGTRLKILEYMAAGKPVVSTAKGAEGLEAEDGLHLVQAEKPEETARAILGLLADPARSAELGGRGRELVRSRYDWDVIAREFGATLVKIVTKKKAGLRGNLIEKATV
jgi:glycosyltransferase involved in cell wall biosynthesis